MLRSFYIELHGKKFKISRGHINFFVTALDPPSLPGAPGRHSGTPLEKMHIPLFWSQFQQSDLEKATGEQILLEQETDFSERLHFCLDIQM